MTHALFQRQRVSGQGFGLFGEPLPALQEVPLLRVWLVRTGPKHPLLYLVGFFAALFIFPPLLSAPFAFAAFLAYPFMILLTVVGLVALARRGVFGPEEHLLFVPVIGWVYGKLFHPATYYAHDTALMFQESIHRAVTDTIGGLLDAQGLRALSEEQKRPTIRDLMG